MLKSSTFSYSHSPAFPSHIPTLSIPLFVFLLVTAIHHYNPANYHKLHPLPRSPPSLHVVTLLFGKNISKIDLRFVEHNCAIIKHSKHFFTIYTEDTSHSFCDHCKCIKFVPKNCKCPQPGRFDCPLCEKLHYLIDLIDTMREFVFIDSDLFIVKDFFLDRLAYRTLAHDFLALGGVSTEVIIKDYRRPFNSGLFFLRRLNNVNYRSLLNLSFQMKANNDQNVLSRFVYMNYDNWDRLSLKWHCRTTKVFYLAPLDECYTIHGRGKVNETLKAIHYTLKSLDPMPAIKMKTGDKTRT